MAGKRRQFSADFKAKVALEAVRGEKTMAQLASEHGVHANQISQWKKQLLDSLPEVFGRRREQEARDQAELVERLYRRIGELTVETDWLKKSWGIDDRGEAGGDRSGSPGVIDQAPMHAPWAKPEHAVLRAATRNGGERAADAHDRRSVFEDAVLRGGADATAFGARSCVRGDCHKREACTAADAFNGIGSGGSEAANYRT